MSTNEIPRREHQRKEAKREERERRRGRRLVRPKEAQKRLGVGHTKFWQDFVATNRLRLVELGPRSKAAVEDELDDLIEKLIAERDAVPATPTKPVAAKPKRRAEQLASS
jgi:hypothetical protein